MAKRNKKKKFPWLLVIIILIIIPVVYLKFIKSEKEHEISYETSQISVMDLESLVSSTGTLSAVGTVEVGTQVSGEIESILVDFNDHVSKGEILAILDQSTLKSNFKDAKANLKRVQAQYELLEEKFANDSTLFAQNYISSYEYKSSRTNLINAETNLISAQISLEKADQNLNEYAVIRSPIDGLVISREIEEGQTVQASMSAPTLFILAENLQNMEIEALIDESDIGLIAPGQEIRFSVEAYPDAEFAGEVRQVRLQPRSVADVVNYTVICTADNASEKLLPGMTATIDFVVDSRDQVQVIANSSLNLKLPDDVMKEIMTKSEGRDRRPPSENRPNEASGNFSRRSRSQDRGMIWYLKDDGSIAGAMIEKGMSNGIYTEVISSRNLPENANIITKINNSGSTTTTSSDSRAGMPRRMGPGLF